VQSICVARVLGHKLAPFDHPGCQETGSLAEPAWLPRVSHSVKVLPCLSTFLVDSGSHVRHPWGQWCHEREQSVGVEVGVPGRLRRGGSIFSGKDTGIHSVKENPMVE